MTDLQWSRSHGDSWEDTRTLTVPRQADPPSDGGVDTSAGVDAADGGVSGFSLHESHNSRTAWDVLSGQGLSLAPLRELLEDIDENANLRSAVVLRAMDACRDALEAVSEDAELDEPVTLTLGEVAVLCRSLMQRLR